MRLAACEKKVPEVESSNFPKPESWAEMVAKQVDTTSGCCCG